MGEPALFDFVVPDELLAEAVKHSGSSEAVAALELVPGTGEGKPPPLLGVLRQYGWAPIIAFGIAAFIPDMVGNGLGILGPNIEHSFRLDDAGLGALTFVAAVAQIAWGLPQAVAADHGSRKVVSAVCLGTYAVVMPLMFFIHNVWPFAFLYMLAAIGIGTSDTVHNSYLADAYPTNARARIFSWRGLNDPLAQTVVILLVGWLAQETHNWRYCLVLALAGLPVALWLLLLKEPLKGANEHLHILRAAGMEGADSEEHRAPRVLLGAAVTRLLRIRSLYYQLVAVAILGFAGTGSGLFLSLFFQRVWHQDTGQRSHIFAIIGLASFLGLPVTYLVGDRLFRKAPQRPLLLAGGAISVYGVFFTASLYVHPLWFVVVLQFLGQAALAPLAISIYQTLAATAPPEMRTICFAMFGVYSLVFGGFAGAILLGAISDATNVTTALTLIGPVCVLGGILLAVGSRFVRRDITLVIEDVIERHSENMRRKSGGAIPALQVHNLDFFYGSQQILFDVNVEIAEGEMAALLGTNGAGKSTLLRAVSGLDHPHRGVVRLFGTNTTYLEPEQIINLGAALLVGGKMTFPGLTVRENLRIGGETIRRNHAKYRATFEEAVATFPELEKLLDQRAGNLSGGEQQMLALSRVMMTQPRLLMIDELALGLAPMTTDRLMGIVRRVHEQGTTVILVEQSVNRAMSLAERSIFLERGEVKFDGLTADLLNRDDLLRPVFLSAASVEG